MGLKILGIETSCDETAVGVVEDGSRLLTNIIASQVDLHSVYGGVVPEVASRQHVRDMVPVVEKAVADGGLTLENIDAIAVTYGPGLGGALITGLNTAKALSFSLDRPLIGVNHLEGHIYASWLTPHVPDEDPGFPLACLIASGGHTDLVLMEGHGSYKLLGRTRDDATEATSYWDAHGTTPRVRPLTKRRESWDWVFPAARRFSEYQRAPPARSGCHAPG
jgi:N6-L-threonylcarbamoyladenine synthase